jgi:hypothetical protein
MILTDELRDRAQAIANRLEEEKKAKQEAENQSQQALKDAALDEFRTLFKGAVSQELIDALSIKMQYDNRGCWVVQTEGSHFNKPTGVQPLAVIRLPGDKAIKIIASPQGQTVKWHLSVPQLSGNKKTWQHDVPLGWIDPEKATLEDAIIAAVYDFEQDWLPYEEAKKAIEAEAEAKRQEKEKLESELESEDELIEGLIEESLEPYQPRWVEGTSIRIFVWRYCCGAIDGDFDYEEIYSLSPHSAWDEELGKSFIKSIWGDRIALIEEAHKPVIREVVVDSLESAHTKLGRIGFYSSREYSIKIKGVHVERINTVYYWHWGGEDCMKFWSDDPHGEMMKPWLRSLLGLPELPESILINNPLIEPTH